LKTLTKAALTITIIILTISPVNEVFASTKSNNIISLNAKINLPSNIYVNSGKSISNNNFSLGVMLDSECNFWLGSSTLQKTSSAANFKLIRLFNENMEPCSFWNDTAKTGVFNWTKVDSIVNSIFSNGAEPLLTLGYLAGGGYIMLPPGMQTTSTGLPSPSSWAAYSTQWVNHFKQTGAKVRYYEIFNEPWWYFYGSSDWTIKPNYTKLQYYRDVFNTAAMSMTTQNQNVSLGFDGSERRYVLDWWLTNNGSNLGFVAFHKYDEGNIGDYNDSQMFSRAETLMINTDSYFYGISDIKQTYFNSRGKTVQVINSESNYDSAYATGTDPEIQQMAGTVWYALKLRSEILAGVNYDIYYDFASGQSWQQAHGTGLGYGMINLDNNAPWYPYYVAKMIGPNLAINDTIVNSTSASPSLEAIAWIHNVTLNVMVVNKANVNQAVAFQGINKTLTITQIDNSISYLNPAAQIVALGAHQSITLNGYAVILAQTPLN